ncbi:hypothetical protein ACWA2B_10155 [Paenibacillus sp. CMM36]
MNKIQYFKIKQGTKYYELVKQHLATILKWKPIYAKVSELLDEEIDLMVQTPKHLQVEYSQLKKEENKKIFKENGTLKSNTKKGKEIEAAYKEIIKEAGLEKYESLIYIYFCDIVIRHLGENIGKFKIYEGEIYCEANFDLEKRTEGSIVQITEEEYRKVS